MTDIKKNDIQLVDLSDYLTISTTVEVIKVQVIKKKMFDQIPLTGYDIISKKPFRVLGQTNEYWLIQWPDESLARVNHPNYREYLNQLIRYKLRGNGIEYTTDQIWEHVQEVCDQSPQLFLG